MSPRHIFFQLKLDTLSLDTCYKCSLSGVYTRFWDDVKLDLKTASTKWQLLAVIVDSNQRQDLDNLYSISKDYFG